MDYHEKKGMTFELELSRRLHRLGDLVVVTEFPVFSFSLRRLSPIDVLVVVGNHVIVLELKNFSSQICGLFSDRTWVGRSSNHNYQVFNPIIQAKEKVRCLQRKFRERRLKHSDFNWNYFVVTPKGCEICADRSFVKSEDEISVTVSELLKSAGGTDKKIINILMTGVI